MAEAAKLGRGNLSWGACGSPAVPHPLYESLMVSVYMYYCILSCLGGYRAWRYGEGGMKGVCGGVVGEVCMHVWRCGRGCMCGCV